MSKVIEADLLSQGRHVPHSPGLVGSRSFNKARRVLVVDNNGGTTRLIKILLEKTGDYVVLEENEPAKAHRTARIFRPDVILLDIVMPGMDGGEVAARIEDDPRLEGTPVIFLTALVTEAEAKGGLEIQGHSFLAKPISIAELTHAIEQHLPGGRKALLRDRTGKR
jgi:CheY-like chemotaxis protein